MSYQAIIFDLDGTLIDSMLLWRRVDAEFLNKRGIEVPGDLFDHLPSGNSFIQTAQYFIDRFRLPDSVESVMSEWTEMVRWHYTHDVSLKPGAGELVSEIAASNIKIGLGTSNSYELAQTVLSANRIWQHFHCAITGDMHLMGKPWPDIYLKCADALQVPAKNCLAVEDTLTGVQAAKTAGMRTFAIYDEDSQPFWERIKALADEAFMDYRQLGQAVRRELGIN